VSECGQSENFIYAVFSHLQKYRPKNPCPVCSNSIREKATFTGLSTVEDDDNQLALTVARLKRCLRGQQYFPGREKSVEVKLESLAR
jgi:hypothetical protein